MLIQYASDFHLEFLENKEFLKTKPLKPVADVLLLGGDIVPFVLLEKHNDFFNFISDNWKTTYWIPGNHEYYYSDASQRSGTFFEKIRKNIFLVNNTVVKIGDVHILFSTMWSKIEPINLWNIQSGLSDFTVIKYKGQNFTPNHFNIFYQESFSFIKSALEQYNNCKTVVMTHHVPTFLNYPPEYKNIILNEGFAVEQFDFIEKSGPNFWIYGHHHCNTIDFKIGDTSLVTNQLGYVKYNEHGLFRIDKTFNI